MQNSERQDIYARITATIVASLEQGVRPWMKPWSGENAAARISRPLRHNGTPYSGINILMLWGAAVEHDFTSPSWMTFRQALALNARVRKGEKGSLVVYANTFTRTEEDAEGQEIDREIPFLKGYTVFNVEQINGLPEHYYRKPEPRFTDIERIEHADVFFAATEADIRYRGGRAYYAQEADYIQMPPIESFRAVESFYATLAHESIHRTKHPSRLNRDFGRKSWGDEGYAREELVAELGAASSAPISKSRRKSRRSTRPTSPPGSRFSKMITAPSSKQPLSHNEPSTTCTVFGRPKPGPPHRRPFNPPLKTRSIPDRSGAVSGIRDNTIFSGARSRSCPHFRQRSTSRFWPTRRP